MVILIANKSGYLSADTDEFEIEDIGYVLFCEALTIGNELLLESIHIWNYGFLWLESINCAVVEQLHTKDCDS